jgi:hypothetical protein
LFALPDRKAVRHPDQTQNLLPISWLGFSAAY